MEDGIPENVIMSDYHHEVWENMDKMNTEQLTMLTAPSFMKEDSTFPSELCEETVRRPEGATDCLYGGPLASFKIKFDNFDEDRMEFDTSMPPSAAGDLQSLAFPPGELWHEGSLTGASGSIDTGVDPSVFSKKKFKIVEVVIPIRKQKPKEEAEDPVRKSAFQGLLNVFSLYCVDSQTSEAFSTSSMACMDPLEFKGTERYETAIVKDVCNKIEQALFKHFSEGQACKIRYKDKYRSLIYNLKDKNNQQLRWRVVNQEISAERLVNMSHEEMANEEFVRMVEDMKKKSIVDALRKKKGDEDADRLLKKVAAEVPDALSELQLQSLSKADLVNDNQRQITESEELESQRPEESELTRPAQSIKSKESARSLECLSILSDETAEHQMTICGAESDKIDSSISAKNSSLIPKIFSDWTGSLRSFTQTEIQVKLQFSPISMEIFRGLSISITGKIVRKAMVDYLVQISRLSSHKILVAPVVAVNEKQESSIFTLVEHLYLVQRCAVVESSGHNFKDCYLVPWDAGGAFPIEPFLSKYGRGWKLGCVVVLHDRRRQLP